MEGILSSEYNSTGYGLYRWIYRSYSTSNSRVSSHDLTQRNGSSITNANGRCRETEFQPNVNTSPGPGGCDSVDPNNSNNCTDRDYYHQFAWSPYGPYEVSTTFTCRIANQDTRLFEFWTRPNARTEDTSGTGLNKSGSNVGFVTATGAAGRDEYGQSTTVRSYDRTNANDSSIQDTKLILKDGTPGSFPYNIEKEDIDNWIMFIATWDGNVQKIHLRNYYDVVNVPSKGHSSFTPSSSYGPVRSNSSKLYIGHGYGDGKGFPSDYKLNLFKGNIDDIRIYSRVITEDEIDTIFNLSDSEPPVPGGYDTTGCSPVWKTAEDDVTRTTNLKYKLVGITGPNRISSVESALINDELNKTWASSTNDSVSGFNGYLNVLVKDEGGNISQYGTFKCP